MTGMVSPRVAKNTLQQPDDNSFWRSENGFQHHIKQTYQPVKETTHRCFGSVRRNASGVSPSGKFNSHYPLLGFDVVKNESGEYTGTYTPNKEELKQVEWIMSRFLQVDRYSTLIEWCKKQNLKTKRGEYFTRDSIRALLTNPRYIGKWYRNKHNADKRQNKLMPYERFTEVKLKHGCVINAELWQKVQDKIKELNKLRAQSSNHCYPLSGLLVSPDGSRFVGNGSWARGIYSSTYYFNGSNKIRVRTEVFEVEAEKILRQVIESSTAYSDSVANYLKQKDDSIGIVAGKITEIDARLGELEDEKKHLDKRLSFLLERGKQEMAQSFMDEYQRGFLALRDEEQDLGNRRRELQSLLNNISSHYNKNAILNKYELFR